MSLSQIALPEVVDLSYKISCIVKHYSLMIIMLIKAFLYLYNTIYTFISTMPPLESLSHSQEHVCVITVLSLNGL